MDPTGRVPLGIEEGDKPLFEDVSKVFKEVTGMTGATALESAGTFEGWAYGHYGVLAFETPVWVRPDLVKKEDKKEGEKKDGEKERDENKEEKAGDRAGGLAGTSPEQIRARLQSATPEERSKLMAEFEALPQDQRDRLRAAFRGGGQGGQPAGPPGGRRRGGGPPGSPAGEGAGTPGAKETEPTGDDAKWLKYDEERVKAGDPSGFVSWQPFKHPQLGEVEIGGWRPGFKLNPPESELPRLIEEQTAFVGKLMAKFPHVVTEGPWVERAGAGLWRVSVRVSNDGYFPTMPAIGAKTRRSLPTLITVDAPLDRIVAGEKHTRAWAIGGPAGSAEATWLVTGSEGDMLKVDVRPSIGASRSLEIKLTEGGR
jgi:hypothetical protein